jgi:HEPN domain-containing protein
MDDYIDTEPYLLFTGAKNDINSIRSELKDEESSKEEKAYNICFHISRAAEKMIKGYIRHKDTNISIKPIHNFDYLYNIVLKLDKTFESLKKDFANFDIYKSWTGYEPKTRIENYEVIDTLKSLKKIYNFKPIKEARNILNKEHNFNTLPDTIPDTLLNIAKGNDILICYKHQEIDQNIDNKFKNMKLNKESFLCKDKSLIKYSQNAFDAKRYILARNIPHNKIELFYVDRDFDGTKAQLFINSWDVKKKKKFS